MSEGTDFYRRVYEIVRKIPEGKVTTYGAIANHLGMKGSARMVGYALRHSFTEAPPIPAHRVVNRKGMLTGKSAFGGDRLMEQLLRNEGILVSDDAVVNFTQHFWNPEDEENL